MELHFDEMAYFKKTVKCRMWDIETFEMEYDAQEMKAFHYMMMSPYIRTMVSTGIQDINGKEIYEGDIIFHLHSEHDRRITGVVRYETKWGGFYFGENRGMNTTTRYVVLGNIYQNPELLKATK